MIIFWLLVSNILYFPFHIWDVILPIDELHHFSRWLKHLKTTNQRMIISDKSGKPQNYRLCGWPDGPKKMDP